MKIKREKEYEENEDNRRKNRYIYILVIIGLSIISSIFICQNNIIRLIYTIILSTILICILFYKRIKKRIIG